MVASHLLPYRENSIIRGEADDFRTQHWDGNLPIDIELIAERDLDIELTPVRGFKMDAMLLGSLSEICYKADVPSNRLRYSIAHELGHRVLHKELIESLRPVHAAPADKLYADWKETIRLFEKPLWARMEYQAYEFAGRLLVPIDRLRAAVAEFSPTLRDMLLDDPTLTEEELVPLAAEAIAPQFEVSTQVIEKRFKAEEIRLL